jgi:DNA processing protein
VDAVASCLWPDVRERHRQVNIAMGRLEPLLQLVRDSGHGALTCLDPLYPALLKTIPDPPVILWTQGDQSLLSQPAVAVVGSRRAFPASLTIARQLARDLADAGLVVVSGMARGVDSAAHLGALDAGGPTIAVTGCGLTNVYPPRNAKLAAAIRETGTIVSELPPDAEPLPSHFPLRNRIISGLARATIVVEAGARSGSLITAMQAVEQGRSVLAVPGNTLSDRHRGSHQLIKDGARLVDTVEDVLEEIGWTRRPVVESTPRNHLQLSDLESNMAMGESYSVDNLARKTRRSASNLLAELSLLELSGRVRRTSSGEYIRLKRPNRVEEQ